LDQLLDKAWSHFRAGFANRPFGGALQFDYVEQLKAFKS